MSTVPTTIPDPTAATEAVMDLESIKEMMDAFDPAALLPELDSVFSLVATVCKVAILAGPIVLLVLGLAYLFLSPKEANYYFGYRCYYGMGSVQAWRFTQRLAGIVLGGLGLVLTGVALVASAGFGSMDAEAVVWRAAGCMILEAVATIAGIVFINVTAAMKFDKKGEFRKKEK